MARKRDVFEQMVEKEYEKWLLGPQTIEGWRSIPLKLLRRYHARVRRMVKDLTFANRQDVSVKAIYWHDAGQHILKHLDLLKKGTR